jgi:hypothetical protein
MEPDAQSQIDSDTLTIQVLEDNAEIQTVAENTQASENTQLVNENSLQRNYQEVDPNTELETKTTETLQSTELHEESRQPLENEIKESPENIMEIDASSLENVEKNYEERLLVTQDLCSDKTQVEKRSEDLTEDADTVMRNEE